MNLPTNLNRQESKIQNALTVPYPGGSERHNGRDSAIGSAFVSATGI